MRPTYNINCYRLNRNGKPILNDSDELIKDTFQGATIKENGVYYFYMGTRGFKYVYKL